MTEVKPFKTIEEQINKLESRNLLFKDKGTASTLLENLNYYRLSGYWISLLSNNQFMHGIYFENIIEIYEFDRQLKLLLLEMLAKVEVRLRTHIAYTLGRINPLCYESHEIFISKEHFDRVSEDISTTKCEWVREKFFKHHQKKYMGKIPIWVLTEMLSFGKLSRLYEFLSKDIRKEIAETYYKSFHFKYLTENFKSLSVLRNVCAHHSRLYNRGFTQNPNFKQTDLDYLKKKGIDTNSFGNKLFPRVLCLFKIIQSQSDLNYFIESVHSLQNKYPFTNLKYYGFPKNWETILYDLAK